MNDSERDRAIAYVKMLSDCGPNSWQAVAAQLDEARRTRIALERIVDALETIAACQHDLADYAEHPVGGGDQ